MGRGSSGIGAGPYGAGMENGAGEAGTTIKSSNPLTDEIGKKGGGIYANDIMNTRDAMEREYGSAVKDLSLHVATFGDNSALGAYGDNTVYMSKHVRNANLTQAMQAAANSGFHPGLGGKSGAEAVSAHEISHHLGQVAAKKAGISEQEIVARAASKMGIKTENMAGHISKYARTNFSETIAEAGADVHCNGAKAAKASIAIMSEVKSILK